MNKMQHRKDQEVSSVVSADTANKRKGSSSGAPPSKKQRVVEGGTAKGVSSFSDHDVLSGRGGGTNLHPGNRFYRDLILMNREKYDIASKAKKPDVARQIVQMIRQSGGRFLRKDKDGLYYDIGDEAAREKTSQALRHRTFEMRNQADARAKQQQQEPTKQQEPKTALSLLQKTSGKESPSLFSRLPPLVSGVALQDALSMSDRSLPRATPADIQQELRLREIARLESEVQTLRQQNLLMGSDSDSSHFLKLRNDNAQELLENERQKLLQFQHSIRQETADLDSLFRMRQHQQEASVNAAVEEQLQQAAANRNFMMSAVGREAFIRQQQQRDLMLRHHLASLSASSIKAAGLPLVSPLTISSLGVGALR